MSASLAIAKILGGKPEQFPFTAEQIAVDVTNGLRAAEIGLRSFRSRPLLKRLWDGLTRTSQRTQAAIGSDIVVVQRATVSLVKEVMESSERTQYCVERVLHNLQAVNQDLDELTTKTSRFQTEFHKMLKKESQLLAKEIENIQRSVQREAAVRRLRDLFLAGELHPGTGEILGSAFYMVHTMRHFIGEPDHLCKQEWNASQAVVKQRVQTHPQHLPDLFLQMVEEVQTEALEQVAYLSHRIQGPASVVLRSLVERRIANVRLDKHVASEATEIASKLYDPDRCLISRLIRPWKLVELIATELLSSPT